MKQYLLPFTLSLLVAPLCGMEVEFDGRKEQPVEGQEAEVVSDERYIITNPRLPKDMLLEILRKLAQKESLKLLVQLICAIKESQDYSKEEAGLYTKYTACYKSLTRQPKLNFTLQKVLAGATGLAFQGKPTNEVCQRVEELIKKGADVRGSHMKCCRGGILVALIHHGLFELAKILLTHGPDATISFEGMDLQLSRVLCDSTLCSQEGREVIFLLIEGGADVNEVAMTTKWAPLSLVIMSKKACAAPVIQKLIESGADVNQICWRMTPLDVAEKWKQPEVIKLLRDAGGKRASELSKANE